MTRLLEEIRVRLAGEEGWTLIEQLLSAVLMVIVLGATLTAFASFITNNRTNTDQNDAQDTARFAVDALTKQLRNLAVPTPTSPNSVDQASAYDLIFKTADPGRRRVRYCLSTTNRVYLQTQTVAGVSAVDPPLPSNSSCPVAPAAGGWATSAVVAEHVVNRAGSQDRPLFSFDAPVTDTPKIREIKAELFTDVNPGRSPVESRLASGIFLRNQNQVPSAAFSAVPGGVRKFIFNGSASSDPEGRTMRFYWFAGDTPNLSNAIADTQYPCEDVDGCIGKGVTLEHAIPTGLTTQKITLLVVDPGRLNATSVKTCDPTSGVCS